MMTKDHNRGTPPRARWKLAVLIFTASALLAGLFSYLFLPSDTPASYRTASWPSQPGPKTADHGRRRTDSPDGGPSDGGLPDNGPPPDTAEPTAPDEIETVLLLGIDRSKHQVGRTDAMVVAAFNHTTDEIGVISIPRDLWVEIPGLYAARINAVMRIGETRIGAGTGLPLLKQVVEKTFGIGIDHTVTADFKGFTSIVDFLEGIPVNVVCPIEDCFHNNDSDEGCDPLVLGVGEHRMDGATALKFARSRHGRTDLDRARRQQAVLAGLKKRLTRPAIIPKLPKLFEKLRRYVQTDLEIGAAIRLGLGLATTDMTSLHGLVLRSPVVKEAVTEDGKEVLMLDQDAAREAIATLFSAPPPGKRLKGSVCPASDVGLHWKDRKKKRRDRSGDAP